MKKYKPYLTRVDLVKNQVERERIQEQEAAKGADNTSSTSTGVDAMANQLDRRKYKFRNT